jgi:hypothetical protein
LSSGASDDESSDISSVLSSSPRRHDDDGGGTLPLRMAPADGTGCFFLFLCELEPIL